LRGSTRIWFGFRFCRPTALSANVISSIKLRRICPSMEMKKEVSLMFSISSNSIWNCLAALKSLSRNFNFSSKDTRVIFSVLNSVSWN